MPLYLKSLDIAGFKSFARPLHLEFSRGISAFVGPNGSGKSNIVDAIRWCLGEQSVRDLRGQRAEDVIYAGPTRTLGAAEVTFTLESEPGDEVHWSEMAIARRLYRSGESEYLLNGSRVRLRDVVAALADVGIDSSRYVVVTQGMADALLSATPGERRALLEQAAGLSSYRERRDEARQKLATTARNLETVEAVLAELEPRVRLLRRQARAVQDRDDAATRLRDVLFSWYAARRRHASEKVEDLRGLVATIGARRTTARHRLAELEARAEAAIELERRWRGELEAATASLHLAERERDALRHEIERLQALAASRSREQSARNDRLNRLRDSRNELRSGIEAIRAECNDLDARLSSLQDEMVELAREQRERSERATAAQRRVSDCEAALREAQREADELERSSRTLDSRQDADAELAQGLERRRRQLAEQLEESRSRLIETSDLITERAAALREREELRRSLELKLQDLTRRHDRLDRLRARARARLHVALRAGEAARRQMAALGTGLGDSPLTTLGVTAGWETAIAGALGSWASGGATEAVIHAHLPADVSRWCSALQEQMTDEAHWAADLVSGWPPDRVNPLMTTVCVESDEAALDLWQRLRSLPGHLIGTPPVVIVARSGLRIDAVGERRGIEDQRASNYLHSKRAEVRAEQRVALASVRYSRLDEAYLNASGVVSELERRVREAAGAETEARDLMRTAEAEHQRLEGSIALLAAELDRSQTESADARTRIRERAAQLEGLRLHVREASAAVDAARDSLERARSRAVEAEQGSVECQSALSRLERESEVLHARQTGQQQLLARASRDIDRLDEEIASIETELQRPVADPERISSELDGLRHSLADLDAVVVAASDRVEQIRAENPSAAEPRPDLGTARVVLSEVIAEHERAVAGLETAEEALSLLDAEIRLELEADPSSLPSAPEPAPTDDAVRRLRIRANQYADADTSVVDEARELEEREAYLHRHLEDLHEATSNLQEIMEAADREMYKRFEQAFSRVGREFSRVCTVMLPGGEGMLSLTEDGSGVEVSARLPGKRTRSSASFSGGERSLVASALLFAVLRIRPTPFCVLDEVDAALDETNVDRYLAMLREISGETQTIVVTHNRATMEAADVLYGLTMDDEGQSNVLSLRLDQYGAAV